MNLRKLITIATLLGSVAMLVFSQQVRAGDWMVTMTKPNNLFLVDLESRSIKNHCKLGFEGEPGIIVMSPDRNIAYILGCRVNWDPGRERFVDDDQANRLLRYAYRPPWHL